jgi:hypothetical protein
MFAFGIISGTTTTAYGKEFTVGTGTTQYFVPFSPLLFQSV